MGCGSVPGAGGVLLGAGGLWPHWESSVFLCPRPSPPVLPWDRLRGGLRRSPTRPVPGALVSKTPRYTRPSSSWGSPENTQ